MSGSAEPTRSPATQPGSASSAPACAKLTFSEELRARQDRLEESTLLVRRLAHDFGNVLTGILGFSELSLSLLSPNSPAYQYASEIHQAAQQGAEFTQALRLFSKRGGKGEHASSLRNILSIESQRLEQSSGSGVEWGSAAADSLPPVAVENDGLRAVLRHVLTNAREALPGSGFITISTRVVTVGEGECRRLLGNPRPGEFVEVRIADSGPGFSVDAKRLLFVEPFFSTKPRRRGLGLAIVYGILHNCQGGFSIEDGAPDGAVVRLFFPVASSAVAGSIKVPGPVAQSNRVLVVDDDPGVLLLVCTTLEQAGYRVQAAADGAEALAQYTAAGSDGFALVLSDVIMPRITGIDLARRLLAQDARANVLLMSGESMSGMDIGDPLHDRFDLLSKPFRPEGLLRAVRAALQRRSPVAQADAGRPVSSPHCAST